MSRGIKKPCEYCSEATILSKEGKNGHQLSVEIYPENNVMGITSFARDENGEVTEEMVTLDYEYCMFCGRKLI